MQADQETTVQNVCDVAVSVNRFGYAVFLAECNDAGEATDILEFAPGADPGTAKRFLSDHPAAVAVLPFEQNGLIGVQLTGEHDRLGAALREISHSDLPPTLAVRDADGSLVLVYQRPHGLEARSLVEVTEGAQGGNVTINYLYDESNITLPPGEGCTFEGGDGVDAVEIADAPAWVIEAMERGPLAVEGVKIPRPENPTIDDLLAVGFYYSKDGELDRLNPNLFVKFLTGCVKFLRSTGDEFYVYVDGVWVRLDDVAVDVLVRNLINAFKPDFWTPTHGKKVRDTLKLAVPTFDPSKEPRTMINLRNAMLDMETLQLRAHHPRYQSTIRVPITYDPAAACPRFRQFLLEIFEGDEGRVRTVQEFMGYCLTAETRAEKALALVGPGANGKSVLLRVLRALVGALNVSSVSLANLQGRFNTFALVGKLINISAENEIRGSLNTELFKTLVSGEPVEVERKFKQRVPYTPYARLVLAMNNLPRTDDTTRGFTRRLLLVPCRRIFTDAEADRRLYDRLLTELPGILNFALEGLKRLREREYVFTESDASEDAWREYRLMLNPYLAFTQAVMKSAPMARVSRQDLKAAFARWCRANGQGALAGEEPRRVFVAIRDALAESGVPFSETTSNGKRYFVNVAVVEDEVTADEDDLFEDEA